MTLGTLKDVLDVLNWYRQRDDIKVENGVLYCPGPTPNTMLEADSSRLAQLGARWSASRGAWEIKP